MAPTLVTVAVLATVSITGAVAEFAEPGLRGGRNLQATQVYCSSFQCPKRTTPKGATSLSISSTEGSACYGDACDESQCCEAKCSYYECPGRSTPKEDADYIVCDDVDSCSDDLCCEAKCSYYQCPDDQTLVDDADSIVCGDVDSCSDHLCCKFPDNGSSSGSPSSSSPSSSSKCSFINGSSCPAGKILKQDPDSIFCDSLCTPAECCEEGVAGENEESPDDDRASSGTASSSTNCAFLGSNNCPSGQSLKEDASSVQCDSLCTVEECCGNGQKCPI